MDWSAIFAGIAALISIFGLWYSVRQHRDNIRREFILWALEQMQSPAERVTRKYLWYMNRENNIEKKKLFVDGIKNSDEKILSSDEYSNIRATFALLNQIGYFWSKTNYGNLDDIKALFPYIPDIWKISKDYVKAIRSRKNQSESYRYFERLAKKLK